MRTALPSALARTLPAPAPAADNPWLAERVLNIAHQGGEDEFRSNRLHAFKRSVPSDPIDWCVDGQMTARGAAFERVLRAHPAPKACP